MIKNYIENANFEDTGFAYTLSLISGKHKMVILYCLMEFETVRFNELKRYLKTISDKTLSTNLKELEADKLIVRTEYPQIPPKRESVQVPMFFLKSFVGFQEFESNSVSAESITLNRMAFLYISPPQSPFPSICLFQINVRIK